MSPIVLHAQTEYKDPSVTVAVEDQSVPSIARPTQVGSTIVVWEDARDLVNGPDIYIQKMDDQTGLPMWIEPDGLPVCTAGGPQRNPVAAYDSLGGVIIAWEDYRNGYADVYAVRLDAATGAVDPAWPVNGIAVCDVQATCEHIRIVGTADGAFITWLDSRNAVGGSNRLVYAQYMLSATASWPTGLGMAWTQNGIRVSVNPGGDQANPEIARDYIWRPDANVVVKSGCVIAYQNAVYHGGQPYWNAYATNLDANGNPGYGGTDVALASLPSEQLYPRIVCSGEEVTADQPRAIVVWQDSREDPLQPRYDIIAQVVDAAGTVQNPMGEIICDVPETQRHPVPVLWERPYDPNTGAPYIPFVTIAWEDSRDYPITGWDIYAGQIDARFLPLGNPGQTGGDVITQAAADQTEVAIDMVPYTSEAFIAWRHEHTVPIGSDIHYQEVDVDTWAYGKVIGGWQVTEAKGDQKLPQVAGQVIVFEDQRRQAISTDPRIDQDIHCQTPGYCTGETLMEWLDVYAKLTSTSDAGLYRMTTDEENNVFVVWDEERPGEGRQIYVQKFDKDGVARWQGGGVRVSNVSEPTTDATLPDVAEDFSGGAQVVWQQTTTSTQQVDVVYAHVSNMGTVDPNEVKNLRVKVPGSTIESREPRIVAVRSSAMGNDGSIIALINTEASEWKRFVQRMEVQPTVSFIHEDPIDQGGNNRFYTNLEIVSHGLGGIHLLSRATDNSTNPPTSLIGVASIEEIPPPNLSFQSHIVDIPYTDFGGYDIAADPMSPVPHRALVAYSIKNQTQNFNVFVERYPGPWVDSQAPWSMPLTAAGGIDQATQPTITPDHVDIGGNSGGMFVAWDYEYVNASWMLVHKVQANRVVFPGGVAFLTPDLDVSLDVTAKTWPDIASQEDFIAGTEPRAMVVWEGGGETSSCSPPRPVEIYGQYIESSVSGGYRGTLWTQEQMVSPGAGIYTQTRPTVLSSEHDTYTTFWLDARSGTDNPKGTRMMHLDSRTIVWMKQPEASRPGQFTASLYPNPVRLGGSSLILDVQNREEEYVRIRVVDVLGREVVTVFDGLLSAGQRQLAMTLPGTLTAGTYLMVLQSATRHSVLPIQILR